jgi:2-polyprenyl-3-methyl-5-hydroxy-6-metoxy-1,4-benzoquinol methylase
MLARIFTLRSKYRLIRSLSKGRNLLDVGCGTGDFLAHCRNKGWAVAGVEPDETARNRAENRHGIRVAGSLGAAVQGEKFDTVTMWHSLEHVHDLNGTLNRLHGILAKKGVLLIAVPNHISLDARLYGEYWAAWDVPRHLYHFSPDTLRQLLQRHGFKLKKTVPMKLDAYYVSLLSEKNKSGRNSFLKSFLNAYKSNSYAKKNRNLYSSLIYIFTR